ncbi:hypothetical protein ACRRRS_14835 [Brucella anthropi]|uniref:hypothetical protein n=1 Tax=Brucella anthropi TaxID=529 RepID=UPI00039C40E4|nr:hypothetical protein [Brucella anthropi]
MAVLSDYTDGTITVTNGSIDFTGTDTLWRSAAFREGDTVLLQGFTGVIAGTSDDDPLILSNTTGQFTEPWPGASGTFSYRMRYQPDNARFSAKSTALINLLANGILRGIADIGVEDGKLLIGNVAGLYDLIDKSELGIQDPNGSIGKLAALQLAANMVLRTNAEGAMEQSQLTSSGVALLKAPPVADGQFLYAIGPDEFSVATLTTWSRSFLASPDAAEQRRIIGYNRPAFKAHLAANQLVYNGTTNLTFTAAPLNVNNGWSGGRFTITQPGTYFFMLNITIGDGFAGQFIPQIFVSNGTNPSSVYSEVVAPIGPQSAQRFYAGGNVGAAIWLNTGSYVEFKLVLDAVQGNPYMGAFRCSATGFLM